MELVGVYKIELFFFLTFPSQALHEKKVSHCRREHPALVSELGLSLGWVNYGDVGKSYPLPICLSSI